METDGNILGQIGGEKGPYNFYCVECDFKCSKKYRWQRHISTLKHAMETNGNFWKPKEGEKGQNQYSCENCKKEFQNRSGLWKHNKKYHSITETQSDTKHLTELVMKVVEQNQELTKQIIDLSKNSHNSSINYSTVNSNNKFNLNVYLNETCKNAINMSDFINSLNVSITDLENTSRLGYAEGVSKIFINGLTDISVHDRPLHCADQKREILYIKEDNEWTKDTKDKAGLTKAIKLIAHKNIKQLSEWQKLNPDYKDPYSKQNDKYQQILCNAISGSTKEESEKNYEKIIRNIAKHTVIEK
jgi:hypothetical protein